MLDKLLADLDDEVSADLGADIELIDADDIDPDDLCAGVPKWVTVDDVVAVFCDLKNSTRLGLGRHVRSTARTYEAATGGLVHALTALDPQFIDIQGDGAYALFTGDLNYERALCAAVTVRTFSERHLVPQLEAKFGDRFPQTGFKTGIATSRLLGKRVGVRGTNEPVWAGRAVNYAAKLAQSTERHTVLVTAKVHQKLADNQYATISCGCPSGAFNQLWTQTMAEKLPAGENIAYRLTSPWCETHGDEFCAAILAGQKNREDVTWAA